MYRQIQTKIDRDRQIHVQTDTYRHRQIQTDTDRYIHTQTDTYRHRQIHTDTDRYRQRHTETNVYKAADQDSQKSPITIYTICICVSLYPGFEGCIMEKGGEELPYDSDPYKCWKWNQDPDTAVPEPAVEEEAEALPECPHSYTLALMDPESSRAAFGCFISMILNEGTMAGVSLISVNFEAV